MRTARRLLALAILAGLGIAAWRFVGANAEATRVDLLWLELGPAPLWGVLLAAFGLGALLGGGALLYQLVRQSLTARRYRKAVASLEAEIHQLRNLPLADREAAVGAGPPVAGTRRRPARGSG